MNSFFGLSPAMAFVFGLPVFLLSLSFHEAAHAWASDRLGDPTAREAGRLTLNPLAHIDPFGTILLPLLLLFTTNFVFGYARPVPTNFYRLRNPFRDIIWVGISGPAANFILALAASLLLRLNIFPSGSFARFLLVYALMINLVLAAFNLVPIPPLDGSRVVLGLLPEKYAYQYSRLEPYGFIIILVLNFLGILDLFIRPILNLLTLLL